MAASDTNDETGLTLAGRLNKFLAWYFGWWRARFEDVRR